MTIHLACSISLSSFLVASSALAQAAAPQAVLDKLRSGQSVEVLAEFEIESVRQQANAMAAAAGRRSNGPEELAYKRAQFASIKVAALAGLEGVTTLRQYENLPTSFVRIDSEAALLALLARSGVRAVFENRSYSPLVAETLPFINQPAVVQTGVGGAGTAVAILDSGALYTRDVFGPCAEPPGTPAPGDPGCRVAATYEAAPEDGALDDYSHGTTVAGIVAEMAPQANLIVVDVVNFSFGGGSPSWSPSTSTVQAGISWIIQNQAAHNIVAFNYSYGTGASATSASQCDASELEAPFQLAIDAGIQPIVAAGNSGTDQSGTFTDGIRDPACLSLLSPPLAVSVGAVYDAAYGGEQVYSNYCTDATASADKVACFSQTAEGLSLLAPGVRVAAAGLGETWGTSFAAPHVAGAWAVMRGAMPNLSHAEILAALQAGGVPVPDHRVPGGRTTPRLRMFVPDADGDAWLYPFDNCSSVFNENQIDSDGDLCGNHCDGDFDNSDLTTIGDFTTFKACFTRTVGAPGGPPADPNCLESDMDGSGAMSIGDFTLFKSEFATGSDVPGPSGEAPLAPEPAASCFR